MHRRSLLIWLNAFVVSSLATQAGITTYTNRALFETALVGLNPAYQHTSNSMKTLTALEATARLKRTH